MSVLLRTRPQPVEPDSWTFPRFERSCLSNGLALLLCHLPDRPVVHLNLVLPGGAERDPAGAEGMAQVVGSSLFEGTGRRDVEEFNVAVEGLGAYFHTMTRWEAIVSLVSVPGSRLAPAVDLLLEALTEPGFRDDDVERVVRLHCDRLELGRAYPQHRAEAAFAGAAFAGTRMAIAEAGEPASVEKLTGPPVRGFWQDVADPTTATLVVAGDLRGLSVERLLDHRLGTWQPAHATECPPALPQVVRREARITVAHQPGAVQSHLAVGHAGPPVLLLERAVLDAGVHYLGGFFSSRLNTVLREEKGVTYGVSARTDHRRPATVVRVDTPVQRDATAEAVADVLAEMRAAVAGDLTPDLVDSAIENIVRSAPAHYQSAGAVAGWLTHMVVNGLPDDFFDRYQEQLSVTTTDSVAEALARHVDPANVSVAVVGDADLIADDLAALGHGPVTVDPVA